MRALLALAIGCASCSWGTVSPDDFKAEFHMAANPTAKPEQNVYAPDGMIRCLDAFRAAVGETDIHAIELDLQSGTWMELQARNPKRLGDVDEYQCRYGEVGASKPVRNPGDSAALDRKTFRFSSIDFAKLPDLIARAPAASGLDGANVSHVIIEADLGMPLIRIYVSNARNDAMLTYNARGVPFDPARDRAPVKPAGSELPHVGRAELAVLSSSTYSLLDDSQVADATQPFDAVAHLPWARAIAKRWRSDAALVSLRIANIAKDGTAALAPATWVPARSWVLYSFSSRDCAVVAGAHGAAGPACVLAMQIQAPDPATTAQVRLGLMHESFADSVETVGCSLAKVLAPIERAFPYAQIQSATLSVVRGRPTWSIETWSGQGKTFTVDATTCAKLD